MLINSAQPESADAIALRDELAEQYGVTCILTNCMALSQEDITNIIKSVLYEFPVYEFGINLPPWVDALDMEHPIKSAIFDTVRTCGNSLDKIGNAQATVELLGKNENIQSAMINEIDLGRGIISAHLELPVSCFTQLSAMNPF